MMFLIQLEKEYEMNPSQELENFINRMTETTLLHRKSIPVSEDIPARVLFDVGATYKWRNLTFGFNVKNLFDKYYEQSGLSTGLIPQRGRWMLFDVAYKF